MNRFVGTATARLSGLRPATGCAGYALYPCPAAASLVEQQRQRHCTNPLKTEFLSRRSRSRTFISIAGTTTPMPLQTCAQCTPVDLYQRWLSLGGVRTAPQGQSGGKDEWLKNRAGLQFLINIFFLHVPLACIPTSMAGSLDIIYSLATIISRRSMSQRPYRILYRSSDDSFYIVLYSNRFLLSPLSSLHRNAKKNKPMQTQNSRGTCFL